MKTKVLHLIGHLKMGGAETLITEYALKINKENFEIIIVTTSRSTNSINEMKLKDHGIKVIYMGDRDIFPNPNNKFKKIINIMNRFKLFAKIVNQEKPNIIHTHLRTIPYILPIKTKKKGIKLFYTVHSEVEVIFNKYYLKLLMKYCISKKGMIPIALHNRMQSEVNSFFNTDSCIVLPNGIDMKRFRNVEINRQKLLNSLNIKKDAFIIGHIGRFAEVKNHKFLVNLFVAVKKECSDAHLILIGEGELKERVQRQVFNLGIQDSVSFLGERSDIPELLNIMDVFVFPSIHEGFGNVLIEAQTAGVRCVVSDSVPKDAIVSNLVASLSLEEPIEKWCRVVINKHNSGEINVGDLNKYDINNIIKKLENIYLENLKR